VTENRVRGVKGPRVRVTLAVLIPICLFVAVGTAKELDFSASVDRTLVGLGERFVLTVTVSGTNMGRVPKPTLPALDGLNDLGSTSSQSTNISFVNGRMTQQQTISYIYYLSPNRLGELTIGSATIEFDGETYQTQPITIIAVKEPQQQAPPPQPQQRRPDPFDPFDMWDPFGQRRQQRQPQTGGTVQENVHVTAYADRTTVYQGEQVTVSYSFYTRLQIGDLQVADAPSFSGFWVETLYDARQLEFTTREYDGQQYNAAAIKRVALFPTRSGELTVGSMRMAGQVVRQGGFFFQGAEPFEKSSGAINITVRPLPDSGRPAGFTGGVGDFEVSAELDKDSSIDGEPLNFIVRVSGTGNIRLIGEPQLPRIMGVKVLSPETKDEISTAGGVVKGTREFRFPLMPQADGRLLVPSIELGFFDPEAEQYYVRATPGLEFYASGAAGRKTVVDAETGMKVLGSDIRYIKPNRSAPFTTGLRDWGGSPAWWGWLFYPAGLLLLATGLVVGRHRRRLEQDRGYARRTRSSRLVKKRLAEASRLLEQNKEREFHAALDRAVLGYVGDRFNIEAQGMTGDELRKELQRRGVGEDAVSALLDLIKDCDAARFSPGMAQCSPRETLGRAQQMLEEL
jgi:hypothetical protein